MLEFDVARNKVRARKSESTRRSAPRSSPAALEVFLPDYRRLRRSLRQSRSTPSQEGSEATPTRVFPGLVDLTDLASETSIVFRDSCSAAVPATERNGNSETGLSSAWREEGVPIHCQVPISASTPAGGFAFSMADPQRSRSQYLHRFLSQPHQIEIQNRLPHCGQGKLRRANQVTAHPAQQANQTMNKRGNRVPRATGCSPSSNARIGPPNTTRAASMPRKNRQKRAGGARTTLWLRSTSRCRGRPSHPPRNFRFGDRDGAEQPD